jgi:hypothetical protein
VAAPPDIGENIPRTIGRMRVRSTGEELFVKSPEDTILRKLLWYREGGELSG